MHMGKKLKFKKRMTRKERVLLALETADRAGRIRVDGRIDESTPDGWVLGYTLCHPAIGGSEGLRRLRELRADGHDIEMRAHPVYGRSSNQYRLVVAQELF